MTIKTIILYTFYLSRSDKDLWKIYFARKLLYKICVKWLSKQEVLSINLQNILQLPGVK